MGQWLPSIFYVQRTVSGALRESNMRGTVPALKELIIEQGGNETGADINKT